MTPQKLAFAVSSAAINWAEWRADFEYAGQSRAGMPVLAKNARWNRFVSEYKVFQQVPMEAREIGMALRAHFCNSSIFEEMLLCDNGDGIDKVAEWTGTLHPHLGRRISLVSKLAAFARPEKFIAWDRFARKGTSRLRGRLDSYQYETYVDFLSDINILWRCEFGKEIIDFVEQSQIPQIPMGDERFRRRVLDNCLMIVGGRWGHAFDSI